MPSSDDVGFDFRAQFERVHIAFCTVLVKREFLPQDSRVKEHLGRSTSSLAAFVFMAPGDAEDFVGTLASKGLVLGEHVGVADMMTGPLAQCEGIHYLRDDSSCPPSWSAFRVLARSDR